MGKNKKPQSFGSPVARAVGPPATRVFQGHVEHRSGPIPSASELEAYGRIFPSLPEEIVKMAMNQSAHRIEVEKKIIFSQQDQARRGQWFGLIAVLAAMGCATLSAMYSHDTFASILGGSTIVSLAGAFISGKYIQKKDLADKAKRSPEPDQSS